MKLNPEEPITGGIFYSNGYYLQKSEGLTKREYFAVMAMQGWIASSSTEYVARPQDTAERAVKYADALINELNKESE